MGLISRVSSRTYRFFKSKPQRFLHPPSPKPGKMPGANKYAVKVGNRFALGSAESGSDSGSEDELQNVDPFAMIKKAEVDAVRKAKNEPEQQTAQPARQNRREPRANNAPRRGPRNERAEKGDNDRQAANQEGGARPPRRQGDGERRRGGPRREKDRQSGDPKTSVRGREKRGGAGSRNWGKPGDEQWEQEEKPTPETEGEEKKEEDNNADQENQEPVPEEPKEPETMTLEDYLKLNAGDAAEQGPTGPVRKANDGQDVKGTRLAKKEIFHDPILRQYNRPTEVVNKKNILPQDKLNFSKYRPARFNNRDNDRNNNRRDRNNKANAKFNIQDQDFPSLGA